MTTHTPAPWHWHNLGDDWCIDGPDQITPIVAPDRKPTPADARLIAAAPDLLAALEAIITSLDKNTHFGAYQWINDKQTVAAFAQARAKIAKAKATQ